MRVSFRRQAAHPAGLLAPASPCPGDPSPALTFGENQPLPVCVHSPLASREQWRVGAPGSWASQSSRARCSEEKLNHFVFLV